MPGNNCFFMGVQSLVGLSIRVYHYLKFHLVAESLTQFSMKNITLSHVINNIKLYSICPGLNNQFHVVVFSILFLNCFLWNCFHLHLILFIKVNGIEFLLASCLFAIRLVSAVHVLVLSQKKC